MTKIYRLIHGHCETCGMQGYVRVPVIAGVLCFDLARCPQCGAGPA